MAVTDEQMAALRALLTGNVIENRRLLAQFERQIDGAAYSALVNAAFFEAVDRRFGKEAPSARVIDYVADVRSRSDEIAENVDANVGERMIRKVVVGESTDDLDSRTSATAKLLLLAALVADENFGNAELGQFLARVRKMADYLLRDT
jgi:hypothetical protein